MGFTNQETPERVSYHEAGHAIMAYLHYVPVFKIVLDFESHERGYVDHEDINFFILSPDGRKRAKSVVRKYLYTYLLINLAGIKAENLMFVWVSGISTQDQRLAIDFDRQLAAIDGKGSEAEGTYMEQAHEEAENILRSHKAVLKELANRLLQNKIIAGVEFLAIMKEFGL